MKQNSEFVRNIKRGLSILLLLFIPLTVIGCKAGKITGSRPGKEKFVILSGSENKVLEPIILDYANKKGFDLSMEYKGSVDIMLELAKGNTAYDALWPANSLWINMGDKNKVVKYQKSIMTSPVVFGIKKSIARKLGFIGKQVSVKDISGAIEDKKLKFIMTSATQSNSGASAYLGFLYAMLGNPETLSTDDLHKPGLNGRIKNLLTGVDRSAGSSEWLKELFPKGNYDAMVNYESLLIETNQVLVAAQKEPLYLIYPFDGLTLADFPLGYISKGDNRKEEIFKGLQGYLLSDEVQRKLLNLGRRTGYGGVMTEPDNQVFNPDWGINPKKILSPIKLPTANVIQEALNLYQTSLRKPSYTIFSLDISASMDGDRFRRLRAAMELLLNQEPAKKYLLQANPNDIVVVMPFSDTIQEVWQGSGDNLGQLTEKIDRLIPFGGTDIYTPTIEALNMAKGVDREKYTPAVILMTDGQSTQGKTFTDLSDYLRTYENDVPVFTIRFGDAPEEQLHQISKLTGGKTFDGRSDLLDAFRKARGYN